MLDLDSYCREISAAYWAEEAEFKAGIHPSQIRERIESVLRKDHIYDPNITFLDWISDGPRVRVSIGGEYYGTFDYEENVFESTPGSRLEENTRDFELYGRD